MMKRALAATLCLILVFALLPKTARADTASPSFVKINDVTLSSPGTYYVNNSSLFDTEEPPDWNAHYKAGVLTLRGLRAENSADIRGCIRVPDGVDGVDYALTIKLEGDSTVSTLAGSAIVINRCSLTIEGSGTLTATGGSVADNLTSCGIDVGGDLTISGGSVTGKGGPGGASSHGVSAAGSITVTGGTLTGEGGRAFGSTGVRATTSITASGGSITGKGGEATGSVGYSYGVYCEGDSGSIKVENGGSITGTTDIPMYAGIDSYGVWTDHYSITLPTDNFRLVGKGILLFSGGLDYNISGDGKYYWRTDENGTYEFSDEWQSHTGDQYLDVRSPLPGISFPTQPANTTVIEGNISGNLTAAASVSPSGTATLNWYACDASGTPTGTSLGTGGSFTIPTDLTAGTHYYLCQAEYTDVKQNSTVATVTVNLPAPTVYQITQGQHSRWIKGSGVGLGFTSNGDYNKFNPGGSVSVDGAVIANSNYTSRSGSTIVTLNAAYLETLPAGRHTLRINFTDGYAETDFFIPGTGGAGGDAGAEDVPKTGDTATPMLWLGMLLLAGAGLAVSAVRRRKRQNG